jgi:histidinol-phosphate aminotransferase
VIKETVMENLLNPHVRQMDPYVPGRPIEEIQRQFKLTRVVKLASNENPFPLPPAVVEAIRGEIAALNLYPDSDSHQLRRAIAVANGVAADQVIAGAGLVDVIHMILAAFLQPGQRVLTSEKTFSLYRIATTEFAGRDAYVEAPMDADMRFDLLALAGRIDDSTKVIFVTNPNNPTGTLVSGKTVREFVARVPADRIVVLDNAYQEFVDDSSDYVDGIAEIRARRNVIVLRTFSKVYGLAGLRVGYAMAHRDTIAALNRVKPPFNLSRLAQVAAIAALSCIGFRDQVVAHVRSQRAHLQAGIERLGLRVIPSQANFLLFFPPADPLELNRRLMARGVIIRPTGSFGVPEGLRVSVGLEEENRFFLEQLEACLGDMRQG